MLLFYWFSTLIPMIFGQFYDFRNTSYIVPSNCSRSEFFDPTNLRCIPCPQNTISIDNLQCVCADNHRITDLSSNGTIQCTPCGNGLRAVGSLCLPCTTTDCKCPSGQFWNFSVASLNNRTTNDTPQCAPCRTGTFSSKDGFSCEICYEADCFCKANPTSCDNQTQTVNTDIYVMGQTHRSAYLEANLPDATSLCTKGNPQACQHLLNMCTLQNYNREAATACDLYDKIKRNIERWPLVLVDADAEQALQKEVITQKYQMRAEGSKGRIELLVARYSRNGTFLGIKEHSAQMFSLCDMRNEEFTFGRRINRACEVSSALLEDQSSYFYELYLKYESENGTQKVYPVAIVNRLIRSNGVEVNLAPKDAGKWVLSRRFFLADTYSITNSEKGTFVLRYVSSFHLNIEMQETRDGLIYPPYVILDYNQVSDTGSSRSLTSLFRLTYSINPDRHDRDVEITMAVLAPTSILWAGLCAYSYSRRNGKQLLSDAVNLIQFVLFAANVLSDVFLLITATIAIWITVCYKWQSYVFYNLINEDQERTFWIYLLVATILKFVALIQRSMQLISQDTFFIDWERQRIVQEPLQHPISRDLRKERKEEAVVVWRTYLIANEWNELRSYRKTSVELQILLIFFFHEFVGVKNFAIVETGFNSDLLHSSSESTWLTRFAVIATMYLFIAFIQWTIQVVAIEKIADPFHNFIDLCSVANISVLSLTHSLYGYYIHGRSVHGKADTGMAEMNMFLQRERDNLCGFRGLETSSEIQTFTVSLPLSFRQKYNEIMAFLRTSVPQVRISGAHPDTAQMTATVQVHEQMNVFLKELVDHSLTDIDYQIRDRTFMEYLLDLETNDTSHVGNFLRDPSEMAFSRCFVYGNEWVYLSFECALFCIIYTTWTSLPIASMVVYLVSTVVRFITNSLSTKTLIRTSLVDHRFLQ